VKSRRTFIKQLSAASMASCIPYKLASQESRGEVGRTSLTNPSEKIWACFMHLSFNFAGGIRNWGGLRKEFEPHQSIWDDAIKRMASQGINMVLMNLDDSVLWHSHPEISLRNSWTPERLRKELVRIRKQGIEPIPVLNFAATHDAWLGKYSRMVSTPEYYKVCKDLIAEAIDIFDTPRFIHFGMDEEIYNHQKHFDHIVIRKNDLWWGDLYFYISEAMTRNVRPWVWSDYVWHNPEKFFKMMPKSVVQSNWYYGETFDPKQQYVKAYIDLEAEGYDQIPTASYHAAPGENVRATNEKSIGNTVQFCSKYIADSRLLGFLQTFWMPTTEKYRPTILKAIDLMGEARNKFNK
jgi:hypothetical protein